MAVENFTHLKDLPLADKNDKNNPLGVDLLIGCDYYWAIVNNQVIRGDSGPVAISSKLGYILSGPLGDSHWTDFTNLVGTHVLEFQSELMSDKLEVKNNLKSFWQNDNIGLSTTNKKVCESFDSDIHFHDGRYEVKFPFRSDHNMIEDNYLLSLNRLKGLWKKMKNDSDLLKNYDDIVQEQLKLKIIEEVPKERYNVGSTSYLPHRPVVKEDRSTSKVRMVFDASAKNKGPALNDCLFSGPTLTITFWNFAQISWSQHGTSGGH